jgi:hypothetical protein
MGDKRIKRFLLTIFCFLVLCTVGYADTYTVASCLQTAVQAAINAAVSGDIVFVPAGACSWSSQVSISSTKKITLQAVGKTSTLITGGGVDMSTSGSRITGFGFTNAEVDADGDGWRIDSNSFAYSSRTLAILINGQRLNAHPTGLIDNNTFTYGAIIIYGDTNSYGTPANASGLWALPDDLGRANSVVFVENNTFQTGGSGTYVSAVDANYGGRCVVRYNTFNNTGIELHGIQSSENRGVSRWELYNNTFSTSTPFWVAYYIRSGHGVIFSNTISSSYTQGILVDNQTSCRYGNGGIACDGSNSRDGNRSGMQGYPCRDQIGRAHDNPEWTEGQPYAQTFSPAYAWNNKKGGSGVSIGITWDVDCPRNTIHLVANRDFYSGAGGTQTSKTSPFNGTVNVGYGLLSNRPDTCTTSSEAGGGVAYWATDTNTLYRCTATNTWATHFTPYTCPHPLTGYTGTCDYTVAGTAGYALNGTTSSSSSGGCYIPTAVYDSDLDPISLCLENLETGFY